MLSSAKPALGQGKLKEALDAANRALAIARESENDLIWASPGELSGRSFAAWNKDELGAPPGLASSVSLIPIRSPVSSRAIKYSKRLTPRVKQRAPCAPGRIRLQNAESRRATKGWRRRKQFCIASARLPGRKRASDSIKIQRELLRPPRGERLKISARPIARH